MEKSQEIFIKAKNSDYLHEIVKKKDWDALIELASIRDSNLIVDFFGSDESIPVLKDMTEEQILLLIDTAPSNVSNLIFQRMESLCDSDSKFTDIAVKLMKGIYTHGGTFDFKNIVKFLPINIIRVIIDSRIPRTEFHFGSSCQEFFMHILSTLSPDSKINYSYKNLKERDCHNGVYIYIQEDFNTFPLSRREVFKELIKATRDSFQYVESNNNLDYKLPFIRDMIINPFLTLINRGLKDEVFDYKNDKEIIDLLRSIFNDFYNSKYFLSVAQHPILSDSGNNGILIQAEILEDCKVIAPNYYYKVFKAAVEMNKDNFIDNITRVLFSSCQKMLFIRELNDGIYDKLFNASIDMTVRELIERKQSENFALCCSLLSYKEIQACNGSYMPTFNECLNFVKNVISKIFEKAQTLNVDVTAYPEICCYMLNRLNANEIVLPVPRNPDIDVKFTITKFSQYTHTALDLLDTEMRNNLVLGVIRHPTDKTKFSHIITSNNPTTLVNFICCLHSVEDIRLILPEAKRNTVDKYGFREVKPSSKMNLVEIFLQTLRFWENNDKSLFKDGYTSYYQFVRKILTESILSKDKELKKLAIDVYYRFAELVSLTKNAKYINIRMEIASVTFLMPLAVIVGSEIDKSFVENFVNKYIQPFNAQSYQSILSNLISKSHLNMNYNDDEEEIDNEVDSLFKTIRIDEQMAKATRLLLSCIKQNPVKNFTLFCNAGIQEDFFTSQKRIIFNIKKKFEALNPKILDVCNPFKTEYPLTMTYNNPFVNPISLTEPQYKVSQLVFLELCRFIADESKEYSPKMFKSNLTKTTIKIQKMVKEMSNGRYDVFRNVFYLNPPTLDTLRLFYDNQSRISFDVLYSKPFFEFLNEIDHDKNLICNDESYEIVKNAFIAQFLNEEDYLQQKNKPPPKFNGFPIPLSFRSHREATNIFNKKKYIEKIKDFKLQVYRTTNSINQDLIRTIERQYNNTKLLDDQPFDDVFTADKTTHKSRELSDSARPVYYRKNVPNCFTRIIDALNKCKAESFSNEFDSLEKLQNFEQINNYGSSKSSYTMLTQLLDLLINDFVSTKTNLTKMYKNRNATYNDIYRFMTIVAQIASPNIGSLSNLDKICGLNEKTVAQKVPNRNTDLFRYIFMCGNVDQILLCMNSPLFSTSASNFNNLLFHELGLVQCKQIIDTLINEVSTNGKQILDDFHVSLASCSIYPKYVGFPAPKSSLEYLKKITSRSIYAKRAACANAIYYAIMCHTANEQIPLEDILEIIESAHKKSPDEITAFFCILISKYASLRKMRSLPALSDLMTEYALPDHYIIDQGIMLTIPKEIGKLYYNVIEKVILSGLKSKKSHIYELTVTVLNEINVGPEIHQIISPFIEKGLKEIEPSDDNEAFLTYATSFTMKNPEFKGCFDSYCEALSKIKKHSLAILKANTHLNRDSPYPEPFRKLENSYSTIIKTIEKPFSEFKEEGEMIPGSQFCRSLLPILKKNRPAVARDVFLRLESYASIFGDEHIEEMVRLYKQDKKEDALTKFIVIVTHHDELALNLPQSIRNIYYHLNSSFTEKHSVELAKNLADSQGKLPVPMQRAYQLADLLAPDVLQHMPTEKDIEGGDEDKLVEVLSNLGIFCKKKEEVAVPYGSLAEKCGVYMESFSNAAPMPTAMAFGGAKRFRNVQTMEAPAPPGMANPTCGALFSNEMAMEKCEAAVDEDEDAVVNQQQQQMMMMNPRFMAKKHGAVMKKKSMNRPLMEAKIMDLADTCDGGICADEAPVEEVEECEMACADEEPEVEAEMDVCDDEEPVEDDAEVEEGGEENGASAEGGADNEAGGESELNQDQINDAFDLFF